MDGAEGALTRDALGRLKARRDAARAMGGPERVATHHASGRLTARERIDVLVDEGSWFELGLLAEPEHRRARPVPADAVVCGLATVDGRKVCVLAVDATAVAGTTAPVNMRKQNRLATWAGDRGLPLILLSDNDGGRIPDVMGWRFSALPFDFGTFTQATPEVPRLVAVLGASFGDSALHAAMGHFVVMVPEASLALSGPPVIEAAIGERVEAAELGGPKVATEVNGAAHAVAPDEEAALGLLRSALQYLPDAADLPAPGALPAPPARDAEELLTLVPSEPRRGYDMRKVLEAIVDGGSLLPWAERLGRSLICAFARLDGQPVGVVASQPLQRAGVLDARALEKQARFVDLCDTFNLPLVFLQDVPGLMIGTHAERDGILAAYERVVARIARATVPKVTVIVRKAYGGAHFALGGRPTRPDLLLAWAGAEMGFMAPEVGVRTVHRRRLDRVAAEEGPAARDTLIRELEAEWVVESEPWEAAANVVLDDVIDPRETRRALLTGIAFAWGSRARVSEAR